ncbi:MAG: DUF3300 domain-containing protein [Burkholderiales bacterium]|nr:DUF3300 domain-containing protein [Burkholderiales bacterium]
MRSLPFATYVAAFACAALAPALHAQAPAPTSPPAAAATAAPAGPTFSQQELEQLVAPIALYPDALLSQVLMASTYPLEVVSAERWVKANPGLKDKALEDALQKQPWDASVKSLTAFPQVLTMMSEKLEWTQKLGDAVLAQQKDVLATAQTLRNKAVAQGSLKDSKEQKVVTAQENNTTIIKIEPTNPEVVYVPTYNPTVVYGAWPYPSYPPYYWYPPGYYAGGALLGFTAGVIVGGALWGGVNWGHGDIDIDVNRYNNFNRTNIGNGNWQHNVDHRGGVPYRDKATATQYGRGQAKDAASRDAFRGRADTGRQQIQRGEVTARDVPGNRAAGAGDRGPGGAQGGLGSGDRGMAGGGGNVADRGGAGVSDRAAGSPGGGGFAARDHGGSAFDTRNAGQARDAGSRGATSMNASRGAGNMSRSAGGGGGARGGGGGGRGGRR